MYFVVVSGVVMRRCCKQHDDCDVICEEKRIAFFHIEKKELLPQDEVTPYATRNKRIKSIKSVGASTDKQHIKRNRLKPYKPPNADFLSAVRLISDCSPLRFCRYLPADHACMQSDALRNHNAAYHQKKSAHKNSAVYDRLHDSERTVCAFCKRCVPAAVQRDMNAPQHEKRRTQNLVYARPREK